MNKKVVLSVLSTAVVASMAASAFAAPKDGLYLGGSVNKYYSTEVLLNMNAAAKTAYQNEVKSITDFNNIVFVDFTGKGASIQEILDEGLAAAKSEALVKEDFATSYTVVKADGTTDGSYDARAAVEPGTTPGDLKVESVSAINLNQVEVKFSNKVDETSATAPGSYKFGTSSLTSDSKIELLEDEKTVLITVDTAVAFSGLPGQGDKKTLTVENVYEKDSYTVKVPKFTQEVTFADTTAPTVKSVTAVGNTKLVVEFSEAVKNAEAGARFLLNGAPLGNFGGSVTYVSKVTDGSTDFSNKVEITFATPLAAGAYKVTVNNGTSSLIEDAAGFRVAKAEKDVTVTTDTTGPVVESVTGSANGTVKVVFNEKIKSNSALTNGFTLNGTAVATGSLGTDGKTVTINFGASQVVSGSNLLVINRNIEDIFGNKMHATTDPRVTFNGEVDTAAPTVSGYTVINDRSVKVTFSEAVNSLYANNTANYVLKDSTGADVTSTYLTTATTNAAPNNKIVDLAFNRLPGGVYTLEISNVRDLTGNVMTKHVGTFTAPDTYGPDVASVLKDATNNKLIVKFDEPMAVSGEGAINAISQYNYSTDGSTYNPFPSNVTAEVQAGNKTVVFTFPSDISVSGISYLKSFNLKDASGNNLRDIVSIDTVTASTGATPVSIVNTASDKPKVYVDGSNAVVEFNTSTALATYDKSKFTLEVGGTSISGSGADTILVAGKNVKLTFTNASIVSAIKDNGNSIKLDVAAAAGADAFGTPLATATGGTEIAVKDVIAPTLAASNAIVQSGSNIVVNFNEAIDANIQGLYKDDFTVTINGAPTVITTASVSGSALTLTTADALAGVVEVVANSTNDIKDVAANAYVPKSTDKATFNFTSAAPTVSLESGVKVTDTDFDVTFTTNAAYQAAITDVVITSAGGYSKTLTGTGYTVSAGKVVVNVPADLAVAGTYTVKVKATGYADASGTISLGAGPASALTVGSANPAVAPGATSNIILTVKDAKGNVVAGEAVTADITVTDTVVTTDEAYEINGTSKNATDTGVAVGTTDASGQVVLTVKVPATVDATDGFALTLKAGTASDNTVGYTAP